MELVEQRREEKWLKFKRQKLKTAIEHILFDLVVPFTYSTFSYAGQPSQTIDEALSYYITCRRVY